MAADGQAGTAFAVPARGVAWGAQIEPVSDGIRERDQEDATTDETLDGATDAASKL
jgi:hypothetical protein